MEQDVYAYFVSAEGDYEDVGIITFEDAFEFYQESGFEFNRTVYSMDGVLVRENNDGDYCVMLNLE